MTSSIEDFPVTKSSKVNFGLIPKSMWEFAIPKSASNNSVSLFCKARLKERFTDIVVLPTPPLPEAIAIVVVIIDPIKLYYKDKLFIYCAKTSFLAKAKDPITDRDPDNMPTLQFSSPKIDNSSAQIWDSSSFVRAIVGKVFL